MIIFKNNRVVATFQMTVSHLFSTSENYIVFSKLILPSLLWYSSSPVSTPLKSNSFIFGDILNQNKQLIYLISNKYVIFGKKFEYYKQHQSKLTVQSSTLYQYLLSWFTCCCCSSQKQCGVHVINLKHFSLKPSSLPGEWSLPLVEALSD